MCLETPVQVLEVDADGVSAEVTSMGRTQRVVLLALDGGAGTVRRGDWLLVHSGLAVERIPESTARDLLELRARALPLGSSPPVPDRSE